MPQERIEGNWLAFFKRACMEFLLDGIVLISRIVGDRFVQCFKQFTKIELAEEGSDLSGAIGFITIVIAFILLTGVTQAQRPAS